MPYGGSGTVVFHDLGGESGVERFATGMNNLYKPLPQDRNKDQVETLSDFIKERNPTKIGINMSSHRYWSFADGITASYKEKLERALGSELSSRLVSAERLCIGWLETRSPQELSAYRYICGIAHDLFADFFSNRVIIPDVTTSDDVIWWIRQKFVELGVGSWFNPFMTVQRYEDGKVIFVEGKTHDEKIIRRGDLLHCDLGIVYLGLCTDTQQNAYVCKIGEDDAPEGLKEALRHGNKLQDILMKEFKAGRTGNEIFLIAIEKAKNAGLNPSIYSHPLGIHGHGAGSVIGLYRKQEPVPIFGDYPLYLNTCHSIELNVMYNVPEWGNQEVRMALEEDAAFTDEGCNFIDGRQTKLYLIR
jgi:Xaa-Pro aminopeptidase